MKINHRFLVAFLLLVSGLMLSSLVPGGPIENRDFSHINLAILLGFNVYLTVLGLGSFVLVFYVARRGQYARYLSIFAGLSYLIIYGIDLLGIFPKTPSEMNDALLWVEVIGSVLAIPLVYFACQLEQKAGLSHVAQSQSGLKWALLSTGGIGIIVFATWSAMSPIT